MDTADILDQVNDGISARPWLRYGMWALGLLLVFALGVLFQATVVAWWNQRKADRQNLDAIVLIIQHNVNNHRLELPPQLIPQAPAPPPAPVKPSEPPK